MSKPHRGKLRPQVLRFVHEYLKDLNGKQAAIRAGYSPPSAESQASDLLRVPKVAALVAKSQAQQLAKTDLSATRVLEEMRRVAMVDSSAFWIGKGAKRRLKPPEEWTPEQGSQVASFEALIKNTEAGDGKQDLIHKLKLWDKVRALEMLGKHFRLLSDLVQIEDMDKLLAELDAGRQRSREGK